MNVGALRSGIGGRRSESFFFNRMKVEVNLEDGTIFRHPKKEGSALITHKGHKF